MDPIEYALDDFGRAITNRDNLPLTLHELAQALYWPLLQVLYHTIGLELNPNWLRLSRL